MAPGSQTLARTRRVAIECPTVLALRSISDILGSLLEVVKWIALVIGFIVVIGTLASESVGGFIGIAGLIVLLACGLLAAMWALLVGSLPGWLGGVAFGAALAVGWGVMAVFFQDS